MQALAPRTEMGAFPHLLPSLGAVSQQGLGEFCAMTVVWLQGQGTPQSQAKGV